MYREDIPGQVSVFQLRAIETIAALVPKHTHIVEVGSLFGRSSYAWAKSVDSSVQVHCIDPWEGNDGVKNIEQQRSVTYGLQQFQEYTKECSNLVAHQGYSPSDFGHWRQEIALYYEDAVHKNPILRENINFWTNHGSETTIYCGDDYRPRFPDVVSEVLQLAGRLERQLIVVDFFWVLLPRTWHNDNIERAKEKLLNIRREADAHYTSNPFSYTLEMLDLPTMAKRSSSHTVKIKLTNESRRMWDFGCGGLVAKINLQLPDEPPHTIGRIDIEPILYPPDISRQFSIDVEIPPELTRNQYVVEIGLYERSGKRLSGRLGPNTDKISVK